jgi:transcription antitermination factor NusG
MPILAPETNLFPENLLLDFTARCEDRRWWAVYTKSRQEKSLARQLIGLDIPFYLPLIPRVTNIGGRRVKSQVPLFNGYLFLYASDEERVQALSTNRIAQAWSATMTSELTRDLQNVQALIESGVPLTTEGQLSAGQRVRVKHGALEGLEGVVISRRGEDRLLVSVQFLQQGVSIQIKDYLLEPI